MKLNKLELTSLTSRPALVAAIAVVLIAAALIGFLVTGGGIIVAALVVPIVWTCLADARDQPRTRELWYWAPALGALLFFVAMSREDSPRGTRAGYCAIALAASTVAAYVALRWLRARPHNQPE